MDLTWNRNDLYISLDTILSSLGEQMHDLKKRMEAFKADDSTWIKETILAFQDVFGKCYEAVECAICLTSIDTKDTQAKNYDQEANSCFSQYLQLEAQLKEELSQLSEQQWKSVIRDGQMQAILPAIQKWRQYDVRERPFIDLEQHGLHGWGELYQMASDRVKLTVDDRIFRANQATRVVYYNDNRNERLDAFEDWKAEWGKVSDLTSTALNHSVGFRLISDHTSTYAKSLEANRIEQKSVQQMWNVVSKAKQPFLDFLKRKADLQHAGEVHWTDQFAPLPYRSYNTKLPLKEGLDMMVTSLNGFDPRLGDFVTKAVREGWIDASVTSDKSTGAFCAVLPSRKQCRVMHHDSEDIQGIGVLAHELGHAYHYGILQKQPMYMQDCPQAFTEIASTLFETIVMEEAITHSTNPLEKMHLLDNQISRDIGTILNSHVRHLFEMKFYKERSEGSISVNRMNDLMVDVQKEVFDHTFSQYDPTFWASLRHFYFMRKPFGHYPYTVAHLLSTGIYHQIKNKENRGDLLDALLADTSSLTIEELAYKHLQEDLSTGMLWEDALQSMFENIERFTNLTRKVESELSL
ncbi:hypothetical protein LCM20_01710 [Halobacillus litoralis]|uniref:hypothetical protein n=1 Tax=Halobacillus litoralis TaxID=45668 RepID=UPI001CD79A06|nr:hypothetical protein [Halobacillus litoralis]MCA0969303.1 hypothetical protein [Halobacillus litoralis]